MSNSIDTRVVEMKFDHAQFGRGVADVLKSLANLKQATKMDGAGKGLDNLHKGISRLPTGINNIANNVQNIASRFTSMGVVGVTALASIASQAVATGAAMLKSLTTDPLKAGLEEYETNLNSIQTILANTGLEGQKGLDQVNHALEELNHYSDQTIYNFSEMARNIGTFTAAGIKLEPATAAIKGIANLAAISGSNAEQASTAMYQLSQAMAAGKATLVDWNSVVNAGMGGKVFQEALKETARVQGVNIDAIIKKNGSFRDSLQEGWLTTKVLTETLSKFTGDLTRDQLKAMGYNEKQIQGIMKMGKTAQDAATKVKTVSQLINTLQEAASSGWAKTWQILFGDFEEARTLFTNVNNVLGGMVGKSADARNKVLADWKAMGGRKVLIDGIAQAFKNVMAVLTPIKQAFRDVFPPTTGKQLFTFTQNFLNLMRKLEIGKGTAEDIRRTFRGLFAIFSIGISVLKGVGILIGTIFDAFSGGGSGLLEFTGDIGDWFVALDQAIKKGEGFQDFFRTLGKIILAPIKGIQILVGIIKDLSSGIDDVDTSGLTNVFDRIGDRFAPLKSLGDVIGRVWDRVLGLLGRVMERFQPLVSIFSDFFSQLGSAISEAFGEADYDSILDGINTGLFAGLLLIFKQFVSNGLKLNFGDGFLDGVTDALDGLTGTLGAMQATLKANALLKIAAAIGILAVSVGLLALIDPKKLTSAMVGLAVMFGQLAGAMALLDLVTSGKSFLKMPFMTASLIALAIAIDLLAIAVSKLSRLNWEELAKGLTGVAVLLGSLALFTKFSSVDAASGLSLILLAAAINLLVRAVEKFAGLSWQEIAKGLTGVAGLLTALALFTKFSAANKGAVAQGAGIVLLAVGINLLATAVEKMGKLSWEQIAKGLTTMAGGLMAMSLALAFIPPSSLFSAAGVVLVALSLSKIGDAVKEMGALGWNEIARGLTTMALALGAIALAIGLLPPSSLLSAAAVFVVAASLGMISSALGEMGDMTWEEIAKGLITLAGALGVIAGAMYLMTGALPGAAATLIVAASLKLLAPILLLFAGLSWGEIAKGLAMLAGVFVIFGVAGLLLAPVIPILIGLGVAITLMGVGMLAAGAGMALFGVGLTAVATAGAAAVGVLIGAVKQILGTLPEIVTMLGAFVVAFANAIVKASPAVVKAIVQVLSDLLDAINRLAPKIIATLMKLLALMLAAMVKYVPQMSSAGLKIINAVLDAIAKNAKQMTTKGTDVVVNFLNGISDNLPRVIQAGIDLAIKFVNGVADGIRNNQSKMNAAGGNLASALISGMVGGISAGIGSVVSAAANMAQQAFNAAKAKLGIKSPSKEFEKLGKFSDQGLAIGFTKYSTYVAKSAAEVGSVAMESLRNSMSNIGNVLTTDADFKPVIRPVLNLSDVEKNASRLNSLLPSGMLNMSTTSAKAQNASAGYESNQTAQMSDASAEPSVQLNYTQNNNSPKALSNAEIYRNTKSQLSTVKGALDNDAK